MKFTVSIDTLISMDPDEEALIIANALGRVYGHPFVTVSHQPEGDEHHG